MESTEATRELFRHAVETIRTRLKEYAAYWQGFRKGRTIQEKSPYLHGPAAVTALHNIYLDIRGKSCPRHGSEQYLQRHDYKWWHEKFRLEFANISR